VAVNLAVYEAVGDVDGRTALLALTVAVSVADEDAVDVTVSEAVGDTVGLTVLLALTVAVSVWLVTCAATPESIVRRTNVIGIEMNL